ncbi:hypothetical protein B0H13DRAFT_2350095 [Mycena leptocephala]|nr:hypothetical protein B0H13DRAFT_2350095 [Mycena leptocephala]
MRSTLGDLTVYYICDEGVADCMLCPIMRGTVDFDTEFWSRLRSANEQRVEQLCISGGAEVVIDFDNICLRLVQIAYRHEVYVLDFTKIKALPVQLSRILLDSTIVKAGFGCQNDVPIL